MKIPAWVKENSKYTWAWILWVVAFGVIEYKAIKDKKKGDTLSEHVWKLAKIKKKPGVFEGEKTAWQAWLFRGALGGLFVWLIPHLFGWAF